MSTYFLDHLSFSQRGVQFIPRDSRKLSHAIMRLRCRMGIFDSSTATGSRCSGRASILRRLSHKTSASSSMSAKSSQRWQDPPKKKWRTSLWALGSRCLAIIDGTPSSSSGHGKGIPASLYRSARWKSITSLPAWAMTSEASDCRQASGEIRSVGFL